MIFTSVSVNPYETYLVVSVGRVFLFSLTPLTPIILPSPLPWGFLRSAQCLPVGLCIYFHQLLGETSLVMIGLGTDL